MPSQRKQSPELTKDNIIDGDGISLGRVGSGGPEEEAPVTPSVLSGVTSDTADNSAPWDFVPEDNPEEPDGERPPLMKRLVPCKFKWLDSRASVKFKLYRDAACMYPGERSYFADFGDGAGPVRLSQMGDPFPYDTLKVADYNLTKAPLESLSPLEFCIPRNKDKKLQMRSHLYSYSYFDEGLRIRGRRSIIGPNVSIGRNVTIGSTSVIGRGTLIRNRALIGNMVYIGANVEIGDDVVIKDLCIIKDGAFIRDGAFIGKGTIIEANADVEEDAVVSSDVRIGTGTRVSHRTDVSKGAVVGNNCVIVEDIKAGAVISDNTRCDGLPPLGTAFVGWKKCALTVALRRAPPKPVLVKLEIPADAKRIRGDRDEDKCRAEFARVLAIYDMDQHKYPDSVTARSGFAPSRCPIVIYKVGEIVEADKWDDRDDSVCGPGIHFFLDLDKAKNY